MPDTATKPDTRNDIHKTKTQSKLSGDAEGAKHDAEAAKRDASRAYDDAKSDAADQYGQARDKASQTAADLKRKASDALDQAKQQGKEQANRLGDRARQSSASFVNQQKDRVAGEVGTFSRAARDAAKRLEDEGDEKVATYAHKAADAMDEARNYLADRDLSGLTRDAGDVARRHPEWVLGGMFVAGLAISRFLKASAERDHAGRYQRYGGRRYAGDTYGSNLHGPTRPEHQADYQPHSDYAAGSTGALPSEHPATRAAYRAAETPDANPLPSPATATVGTAGTTGTRTSDVGTTGVSTTGVNTTSDDVATQGSAVDTGAFDVGTGRDKRAGTGTADLTGPGATPTQDTLSEDNMAGGRKENA